jgi:hypothetical protein
VQVHERYFHKSSGGRGEDVREHLQAVHARVLSGCRIAFTTKAAWYQQERDLAEQVSFIFVQCIVVLSFPIS